MGGHCIPVDPWLLAHSVEKAGGQASLVPAARRVNDSMPHHVVELLRKALEEHGHGLSEARILVLGQAYRENTDDVRNSPTDRLVGHLAAAGARATVHDPCVRGLDDSLRSLPGPFDAAIAMVRHDAYRRLEPALLKSLLTQPVVVDARDVFDWAKTSAEGFTYRAIGTGRRNPAS